MAEPAPPQPTSSAAVPTTKTKLFTLGDEGTWTEIGVGVATIQYEAAIPSSDGSTTELSPKLVIESLEDDASELLLSTPLSTEDIYQVQKGTILVWTDPELARDMAASFHTAEGCRQIMDEIRRYQTENAKTHDLLGTLSENSALSEELSPWAVTKQNLPALAIAVQSNKQRFAMYFNSNTNGRDSRDDSNKNRFYADLVKLFVSSRDEGDLSTQRQIGEIVYALLSKPFSLDNRILGVLVDEDVIEWTVDIVQVHLGRVDASTGFVSTAERRAKFRDAGLFTDLMLKRCHFVAEIQTLRDLLPLQLEDGDAGNMGSLALYCLRLKYELLADVCGTTMGDIVRARDVAPHLFTESLMKFMPLLHDLCTTIKVSPLPLEPKDGLLKDAVSNGLLKLAAAAFRFYVRVSPQDEVQLVDPAASVYIIGRLADIIGSCAAFTPSATREALLGDVMSCVHAPERPPAEILPPVEREVEDRRPLVELLLAAMTASDDDVLQQSLFDALQLITVGLQATALAPTTLSAQKLKLALIRYMVSGVAIETAQSPSPLRLLLTGMRTNVASRPYAYCAKALVFVFQRLLTMDGIIGPGRELEPILHRVVGVLQNGDAPRLVLDAMTRHDVKTGSKTAALQFFASVFAPPDYHQLVGVFAEWSGLSELACVLHHSLCLGRRRQNILFGAVSSVISSLCSSLDQDPEIERQLAQPFTPVVAQIEAISRTLSVGSPSWHAEVNHVVALASLRQRRQFCSRIAKVILSVDSDRLRLANPLAFAALDAVAKDHLDADPCDAREASVQSAAVGATGSRNGFSPDGGGVADTGASPDRNPFLPHRSRSQSNEAAAPSFGRSVDEEYQALMADFDAVVPVVVASRLDLDSPPGGGDDVTPADDATTDQLDELPLKRTRSEQFSSS